MSGARRAPALAYLTYEAAGWGVGEIVFDRDTPLYHDPPAAREHRGDGGRSSAQAALIARLVAYFAGERVTFADVDLEPVLARDGATEFEHDAVRALQRVDYGETISYAELAARAGRPRAARGAGRACAHGTLSVIVPYHRVIRSDGSLGEYGPGGAERKRRLLALEGVAVP